MAKGIALKPPGKIRKSLTTLFAVFTLAQCTGMDAQTLPREQEFQAWDDATLIKIVGPNRIIVEEGPGKKKKEFTIPSEYHKEWKFDYLNKAFWSCLSEERDGTPCLVLYQAPEGKGIDQYAWSPNKIDQGQIRMVHPLPQDQFLLVSHRLFKHDNKQSFLAIARLGKDNRLEFREIVETEVGERFFENTNPAIPDQDFLKTLYLVGFQSKFVRGRNHLAFINAKAGRLILFDVNKKSSKYIKIFPDHPDAEGWTPKLFDLEYVILGIQPTGDGHFTLATRSQEAMLKAREAERATGHNRVNVPRTGDKDQEREALREGLKNPRRLEQAESSAKVGAVIYPEILWWDLDPETGKLTRKIPNTGIPESIHQVERLKQFRFRTNYQGDIEMD